MINCKVFGTLTTSVDTISFNQKEKRSNLHGDTDLSPMSVKQGTICFHYSKCLGKLSESVWKPGHFSTGNSKLFFFRKGGCLFAAVQVMHDQNNGLISTNVLARAGLHLKHSRFKGNPRCSALVIAN